MGKKLVAYSQGEEIFNGVSHIIGGALGIFAFLFSFIIFGFRKESTELFGLLVYSLTLIILYTMSTLYHIIKNNKAKQVLRIFDHCCIFLLIGGTYTPYILIGLPSKVGYLTLAFVWIMAIIGMILNGINMHHIVVKIFSYVAYVIMGWCIIFNAGALLNSIGTTSLLLLLFGGIVYTIGFVLYAVGKKKKWFHSIWHLFVLIASIMHFISILIMIFR